MGIMAVLSVFPVLLVVFVVRCSSEPAGAHTYHNRNDASQFGELLRPPPPPLLPIIPLPFHGGAVRSQHQNNDFNYQYQVPPPPQSPLPPISPPTDFKFPAPFYKQYNFNFVPTPHPFTTTPSPSIFQKVSQWLFPSQQTADDANIGSSLNYRISPIQKDCNPCNLAPWIPVIRYDLAAKNNPEKLKQSYGPPALLASANVYNTIQNVPQRFNKQSPGTSQFSTDSSHNTYGAPKQIFKESLVSSTYGPPSPTHTVTIPQENSFTSHNPIITPSYEISSNSFVSSTSFRNPSSSYGVPSSSIFVTPPPLYSSSISNYNSQFKSTQLPEHKQFEFISTIKPSNDFELPKVEPPTGFKNSYGEPIVNTNVLDIPYSIAAAESSKIKTEVLPDSPITTNPNTTLALANPAPFSLNRGRNIHTLQPVALPNLSVSPLPPIFNARPFRRFPQNFQTNNNNVDQHLSNLNIAKSIPIAEIVEYPATIIQSPVIDLETTKSSNQTKSYRHIPNSFTVDNNHDITPQASELSPSDSESSFESTGVDYANDLYDTVLPSELKQQFSVPSNHRPVFADLRGLKDEDIDKYRTDSNLQHIDSPLLYLKPSAPHKKFENFRLPSVAKNTKEYEIYDEVPTTESSPESTLTSAWDETRSYFSKETSPSKNEQNINRSKVVQIIVPYTNGNIDDGTNYFDLRDWPLPLEKEAQPRKVYTDTASNIPNPTTESYVSSTLSTELSTQTVTESSENFNTPSMINDFYDVKEPPFDIIKLQHTIDDWTQQAYSKDFSKPEKSRSNDKYAKQIPDDFLTTLNPITSVGTEGNIDHYDTYDHEVSSSIQYFVRENKSVIAPKPFKLYNSIEQTKVDNQHIKGKDMQDSNYKLHIYTAASKFRKATTTPPPWGHIQTSISPLTKEKVYVVTSKPWREASGSSNENEYDKKVESQSPSSNDGYDKLPFKSPRFSNRPAIDDQISLFSKGWHQNINNLENRRMIENTSFEESLTENEEEKSKRDETTR